MSAKDDKTIMVEACDRDGHDEHEWDRPIRITLINNCDIEIL